MDNLVLLKILIISRFTAYICEQVESLWVGVSARGSKGNLVAGVCYSRLTKGSPLTKPWLQPQEVLCLQSLVLGGNSATPAAPGMHGG